MAEVPQDPHKKRYQSLRQQQRQAAILATARSMLAEDGYESTTIRSLAERAKVAPGTLYNLYRSKDELIHAAVADLLDEIGERAARLAPSGLPRMLYLASESRNTIVGNPAYALAMSKAVFKADEDDALNAKLYMRTYDYAGEQLMIAQQADMLIETDLEPYLTHLTTLPWGCLMAWAKGAFTLEQLADEYLRVYQFVLTPALTEQGHEVMRSWLETQSNIYS